MFRIETNRLAVRWIATALAILVLTGALPSISTAQDCEIPLFVQQNLVGANLMLLVDNSMSMNAASYHPDYDRNTVYASSYFNVDSTYYINTDGFKQPRDFNITFPGTPSAYLVNSDNGQNGIYSGNYLAWIFEYATDDQRDDLPRVTRIQVLKTVLSDLVYRSLRLRVGLTDFYPLLDGGNILAFCEGGNELAVVGVINAMVANTYTQLGEAMETILDYFTDDSPTAVIENHCQYNFCIVVTDGMPSMDINVSPYLLDADGDGKDPGDCESIGSPYENFMDCSDHFDDVAYYMAHEDLRPDLEGDQHVFTYVVGFNEDGTLLREAAENGLGLFFYANNSNELANCLEYAVQDILRRISAGSAVAVVSTEQGADDRLYRGKFMPVDWDGFLECYSLPYADGDEAVWEAGNLLQGRDPSDREIFTALGTNVYGFTESNAADLRLDLGAVSDEHAADLINWGRGNNVTGMRDRRGWVLGDIVHSTPVVVGPPASYTSEESCELFRTAHQDRQRMVYVGANDGMLHAFDADTGEESWAFVPEFALPKFPVMADSFYCHTYSCDQTPAVKDIPVGGIWKTVLVSGGREGGSSIFALDITYPDSPEVLWQNELPNGMPFSSDVRIVSINETAVALVGSGLDEVDADAFLYAYDIDSGAPEGEILLDTAKERNKATRPEVVDLNLDGQADLAYVADLGGNVWRINFKESASPAGWSITLLYEGDEEITASPVAAYGPGGDIYVYFGTGAYLTEDDMMTVDQQKFVCVYDKHDEATVDDSDLVNQTASINPINAARGWYVDLWNGEGERVAEQAAVVAETVVFTSFKPSLDACLAGGESWLYQMAYDTGGFAPEADDTGDESDRSISLGEGIASHPVVDLAEGTAVVQSSDASISVEKIASIIKLLTVRSWQESFETDEEETETETEPET